MIETPTEEITQITLHMTDLGRILEIKSHIEAHGGEWLPLTQGMHMVRLPSGTTQTRLDCSTEQMQVYRVNLPDGSNLEHCRMLPHGVEPDDTWAKTLVESKLYLLP